MEDVDIAVVGLGAVGTALARAIERDGSQRSLTLYSRRPAAARRLGDELGRATVTADLAEVAGAANLVILCARDDELADRAQDLADAATPATNAVLLHTSGFFGADVLAPAARAGWQTGAMHPLHSFRGASGHDLDRTSFTIEGTGRASVLAHQLVRALGGKSLELRDGPASRARYHAAAVLLSNGLVALFDTASEVFGAAVEGSEDARREALWNLLVPGSVEGLLTGPAEDALTGPISRGDASVVSGHLRALAGEPELSELYRRLSLRMVEIARRGDRAKPADLDTIAELLSRPPPTA